MKINVGLTERYVCCFAKACVIYMYITSRSRYWPGARCWLLLGFVAHRIGAACFFFDWTDIQYVYTYECISMYFYVYVFHFDGYDELDAGCFLYVGLTESECVIYTRIYIFAWNDTICIYIYMCMYICVDMGWLRLVGSLKLQVSFAEYRLFYRALLQKRPIIQRSLLAEATP